MIDADVRIRRLCSDVHSLWRQQHRNEPDAELAKDLKRREHVLLMRLGQYYQRLHAPPRRWRRGIGWRLRHSLAGVALLLALGHGAAFAAIIAVDGNTCSRTDAITAANTDTATGRCVAGSSADTLVLPAGSTTTLTAVDNNIYDYGPNVLPIVDSEITISGRSSTIRRSSAPSTPASRIFWISQLQDLSLENTTISGGVGVDVGGGIRNVGSPTADNRRRTSRSQGEER